MTRGKPLSLIIGFCIPMLLGNLFQQLYNMVDTIVVGRYVGVDALSAVGATGSISFLVIGFVSGIRSGFSINMAQSFGAGDIIQMRRYATNALYLCGAFTIVLTTVTMIFTRQLLVFMKTPEDIIQMSYDYIIIIFAGIGATMLYNMLAGMLRALGDSKSPLFFLIIASVLNVILDLVLVIGLNMGVRGAGLATVISQLVSALLCVVYIKKRVEILHFDKEDMPFDLNKCVSLVKIGVPMALQFSITAIGSIILQSAVNSLGKAAVAACTTSNKIQQIVVAPLETMGITMATFCGQNLGAGQVKRVKQGIRQSLFVALAYSVVGFAIVFFFSETLALLFVKGEELAPIKADIGFFLTMNGIFYPVLAVLFIFRNSLQGMGFSMLPMMAGLSELLARAIVSFGFVKRFGFPAVALAAPVAWAFAVVLLLIVYIVKMRGLDKTLKEQELTA